MSSDRDRPDPPGLNREFGPDLSGASLAKRRLIGLVMIVVFVGVILLAVFGA